ncbi:MULTISPECIES: DNA primase [unclassified Roseitalea]|uniref:DNA primase n=1 Tax=unclassified Roseitalea TaxID=2639107 RepID=UPI00273D9C40|nr:MULTISPECIES: DNA primase [unclassified Roseitalea]
MRFSQTFLDEIRERLPISEVIGQRVTWDRRKTNARRGDYWACCPFHGEKTPSFHCEDRKGRYYCFGCGASGDHFRFLTELDGLAFPEAVERIASMAGIAMPEPDPEAEQRERQRATLHDVMEQAANFFESRLQMQAGAAARAYLRDRGLTAETIARFRLGYAPDSRSALKEHLAQKGATKDQIEQCGLVVHGEDIAVSYDRFRDRIIFPIEDAQGRVIAFGGRAMSADVPAKYLNSPEGPLFHKSDVLYNFRRARSAATRGGRLIAVEGYMDVIALDQAGISTALAPLGTALTESQLGRIWRVSEEPVLCFDGDQAGLRAAFRTLDLALPELKPGRSLRFALLPDGTDPDDLVRDGGARAFEGVLGEARSAADMLWLRETGGRSFETPERRAQLEAALREATGRIGDDSVRRHYAQEMRERVAAFFGMSGGGQRSGERRAGQGQGQRLPRGRIAVSDRLARSRLVSARAGGELPLREAALISAVICHPDLINEAFDDFVAMEFEHAGLEAMRGAVLEAHAASGARTREDLLAAPALVAHGALIEAVDAAVRRGRLWAFTHEAAYDDAREAFAQAMTLHRRTRGLSRELRAAEAALAEEPTETNYYRLLSVQAEVRRQQGLDALLEGFGVQSGRPTRSF